MKFWRTNSGTTSPLSVAERIAVLNSVLDERLDDAGFYRLGEDADWRRERSAAVHDRLVVSYGRKYAPASVSCSPVVEVYSSALVEEVRKRFGAEFSKNNFGARNLGFYMPCHTFSSWDCGQEFGPTQVANEIADAFLRYGVPILEKVRSFDDLAAFIEHIRVDDDPHNKMMSSIAPACLAFLRGRNEECRRKLIEMLADLDQIGDRDPWASKHLPKRTRIEKFINSLP